MHGKWAGVTFPVGVDSLMCHGGHIEVVVLRSIAQYFPFKQICPFLTAMKSVLSVYSSIFFFYFFFPSNNRRHKTAL